MASNVVYSPIAHLPAGSQGFSQTKAKKSVLISEIREKRLGHVRLLLTDYTDLQRLENKSVLISEICEIKKL